MPGPRPFRKHTSALHDRAGHVRPLPHSREKHTIRIVPGLDGVFLYQLQLCSHKRYRLFPALLVDADVLPEVFVKVLQAKELLASGAVSNISAAAKQAGISRSAFYKYKDTVFDAETGRESITVVATLLDKTGALQGLLSGISAAGASIVTITQSRPENGAAQVEVTVRTGTMQMPVDEMLTRLSHQPCVVEIHRGA